MTIKQVKRKIREKNLTQAELARRCRVSGAAMCLFINRKSTSARLERRVSAELGITTDELRGEVRAA